MRARKAARIYTRTFRVRAREAARIYWFTSYLIRTLIPYHGHLLLLLSYVVIVVNLCCVEGFMEDRCISNKQSR